MRIQVCGGELVSWQLTVGWHTRHDRRHPFTTGPTRPRRGDGARVALSAARATGFAEGMALRDRIAALSQGTVSAGLACLSIEAVVG